MVTTKKFLYEIFRSLFNSTSSVESSQWNINVLSEFKSQFTRLSHDIEVLLLIPLDKKSKILGCYKVYVGSESFINVDSHEPIARIIGRDSSIDTIVLAHNHPSGICLPTSNDVEYTRHLKTFLRKFDVGIKDHFVVTKTKYFSLAENNLF